MNSWLIGIVSLVVGAVIGFMYANSETGKAKEQLSAVQSQMSEKVSGLEAALAKAKKDAEGVMTELTTFKNDVGEKSKMIDELKAKIKSMEPAGQAAPAKPQ